MLLNRGESVVNDGAQQVLMQLPEHLVSALPTEVPNASDQAWMAFNMGLAMEL